ncbi:MAG: adaptor protein MecA [Defluviitaleaceae bacterium]|nr:adaptor protein MecA [Defluviitaleaceae bacterium]
MRIEKVNDNQIKFILSKEELALRGINITQLNKADNKLQLLVDEVKHLALSQAGFFLHDAHHIVEMVPTHFEELTVIITKMNIANKSIKAPNFQHIQSSSSEKPPSEQQSFRKFQRETRESRRRKNVYIYSFNSLEEVIEISRLISGYFLGYSKIYKFENEYYLVMEGRLGEEGLSFLAEHGEEVKNLKLESKLKEYGEIILEKDAIFKLSKL